MRVASAADEEGLVALDYPRAAGQLPLRGAALEVAVRREDVAHRVEPALERLLGLPALARRG